ncbi:carboxylesterase family protein [Nonomuraea guangzhouensis]|uniref:Carboxylesterase family protein n=1 Tax=Nonomuraea guangzhouensis TaxID=1291555 RepID=A0ABW4GJM4_9ACTN|nr:carboxylesterase family protein [Nonomuraea guangzhouensis]
MDLLRAGSRTSGDRGRGMLARAGRGAAAVVAGLGLLCGSGAALLRRTGRQGAGPLPAGQVRRAPWASSTPVVPSFPTGAFHASELQYLFAADYFAGRSLSPDQSRLSDTMIDYWSRFAHHGDPNGPATPPWPAVRAGQDFVQRLAPGVSGIRPVDLCREHQCRFWQSPEGAS